MLHDLEPSILSREVPKYTTQKYNCFWHVGGCLIVIFVVVMLQDLTIPQLHQHDRQTLIEYEQHIL